MGKKKERARQRAEENKSRFIFRENDHIGAIDAAADVSYLSDCFVDTGVLEALLDFEDHRQLLIARTGAGKTALLEHVANSSSDSKVLKIPAEALALNHITNSTILTFVRKLGVNLDIFFKLLWRHVFAIEILRDRFSISDEGKKRTVFQRFRDLFKNSNHKRAIEYLEKWGGERFWLETDTRIVELTSRLEDELKTALSSDIPHLGKLDVSWLQKATDEKKSEVAERTQRVVDKAQMQELSWVIDLVHDALEQGNSTYLILIDRLDETWVEDEIRYLLIRALIETVRDFLRVTNCKILVAMRRDLIDRVFEQTKDKHFQEEKYKSMFVSIKWATSQLAEMIDRRLGKLVRRKYENVPAKFSDLFPARVNDETTFQYLVDRTQQRPRDMIHFVNLCIEKAAGRPLVTKDMVLGAESEYVWVPVILT